MTSALPQISVAETLAEKIVALKPGGLADATSRKCEDLLIDVVGLCVTARNEDYIGSALAGCDDDGPCTAIGHKRTLSAAGAAFVNGTAAHGEDFDDTFEGGPVHAGAVIVPTVLAVAERNKIEGRDTLRSMAVGVEVMCRDAAQGISSFDLVSFCNGKNGGHDHRACVHRPALESVVEVLAVRRGAVDEGSTRRIERA